MASNLTELKVVNLGSKFEMSRPAQKSEQIDKSYL